MSYDNPHTESFAEYLQSMCKLDALERMTADIDRELSDSQNIMKEIKRLFDTIPKSYTHNFERSEAEDISRFVKGTTPNLLLPDMAVTDVVEIDKIVASMKSYAESLRKNLNEKTCKTEFKTVHVDNLNLTSCAKSLEQLSKSLAKIKITTEVGEKSVELEGKLGQLCEDVTLFTQMVNVNGRLEENIQSCDNSSDTLLVPYDNIINKLLTDINEVTYLLKNNN